MRSIIKMATASFISFMGFSQVVHADDIISAATPDAPVVSENGDIHGGNLNLDAYKSHLKLMGELAKVDQGYRELVQKENHSVGNKKVININVSDRKNNVPTIHVKYGVVSPISFFNSNGTPLNIEYIISDHSHLDVLGSEETKKDVGTNNMYVMPSQTPDYVGDAVSNINVKLKGIDTPVNLFIETNEPIKFDNQVYIYVKK